MKDYTVNMTEGSPVKHILVFCLPMLLGNIFQQVYNLADSIIVGQLVGANALAAIGAQGSIGFFFIALCNGFGTGGGILVSQSFGEGYVSKIKNCIANTGYIMVLLPLIVGTASFFSAPLLLKMLSTPDNIMDDAVIYLQLSSIGILFVSIYNYIASMMRAMGDSRTPLYFLIFSCILNAGLDILFILAFKMGVFGAGLATLLSQFISNVLCIFYAFKYNSYFKLSRDNLRVNKKILWNTIKLGLPLSLQYSLIAISCMALQRVVNSFGAIAVAAFSAMSRVEQVIHQPYQTLSASLSTFTGQNFGANKFKRAITGYRKSILIMVIFTLIMVPLIHAFSEQIMAIFVNDADVIAMGGKALRITSLFYLFLGLIYVVRGYLQGIGDGFFALLNGLVEVFGRFVVPVLLVQIPAIGVWGIWWSVGIVWFLSGATAWLRYLVKREF